MHSHLRMDGSWRIDPTAQSPAAVVRRRDGDVRAVLANREWTATGLLLGMLDLVATRDEHTLVGHLGPDILGPDWDQAKVLETLRSQPDRTIGEALLDQRVLAGVGTFYLAETMFLIGRTPWTPVRDLIGPDGAATRMRDSRVVERARRLLLLNRDRVGQVTTGDARPGHEAFVHGRSGRPCRRCGTTVRVARLGSPPTDRVAFYCPACQRGSGPHRRRDTATPARLEPAGALNEGWSGLVGRCWVRRRRRRPGPDRTPPAARPPRRSRARHRPRARRPG